MPVILIAAGVYALPNVMTMFQGESTIPANLVTEVVKRGPFKVSVVEKGTIDSSRNTTLTSSVEGNTTIISIVPEGSLVKAGDIVCELDSSALQDKARQQEIQVTEARAKLAKAEEDLKIQNLQNESDIAAAELALELVKLDVKKFEEGENEQQLNDLRGQLALDEENLKRAQEKYEFSKENAKKGYINQNTLEGDRLSVQSFQLKVSASRDKLNVYDKYQQERLRAELNANEVEFGRELERVKSKAKANLASAESEVTKNKLTLKVEDDKMDRWTKQIAACTLRAPNDGEVVYANDDGGRRGNNERVIEEGASVHERQAIIKLPDNSHMKVGSKIHESRISQVRLGLPVSIMVDAIPGVIYHGVVESVSSVPLSGNWMQQDLKEYECNITITDKDVAKVRELKSGMTAQVEILVNSRPDVLQAPVQSVVQIGEDRYVYVATPENVERRSIKMGQTNDVTVEILDGLAEGERIVLNPRTAFSKEIIDLEAQAKSDKSEEAAAAEAATASENPAVGSDASQQGEENRPRRSNREGRSDGEGSSDGPSADTNAGPGGGSRLGGGGSRDPAAMFAKLDANGDGSLTEDEIPAQMRTFMPFATLDTDSDGKVTQDEMVKAIEKLKAAGGFGGGRGGPGGEGGDRGSRRNRSNGEE